MEQAGPRLAGHEVAEKELEGGCHDEPYPAVEESQPSGADGRYASEEPDVDRKETKPYDRRELVGAQLGHMRPIHLLTKGSVSDRNNKQAAPVSHIYQDCSHYHPSYP